MRIILFWWVGVFIVAIVASMFLYAVSRLIIYL